ncbi:heme/hemin ABC transporter substrate-binding protein [Sneathiella chinensis]|uniref:Hemin ABC transporter substrate-binding protein n=1 Tax=Sneathiella chinensis TaxID=349750 RepID=A0ABQ5TY40_9PROT|nr:hemin ABC transporter substrate-binding protein [Sneathiella chinensis]GLQ04787.1 hemin ABC transporter substrate-binding protein [Sneathiella chinensis]
MRTLLAAFLLVLCPVLSVADTPGQINSPDRANSPNRIVSVGGALTEIIYALGEQGRLVGSDTTSYFPPEAEALPKVGYQRALSAEGILSLRPDTILMNDEAGPPPVLKQLAASKVRLVSLPSATDLDGIRRNIRAVGALLDVPGTADALLQTFDKTVADLTAVTARQSDRPRVLYMMNHGSGSPMVAGRDTSADSIITLAGGQNVVDGYTGYKPLTPEAAAAHAPDVILVSTRTLEQAGGMESLLRIPGLNLTPAARNRRIIPMDDLLLLGFGPRTPAAALDLNKRLHSQ